MRVTGVRALSFVGAVFLLIGLARLAVAGALAFAEGHSGRVAHAEGTIVSADYRALIEFRTPQGETVRFRNSIGSMATSDGQVVPVAYDPADPRNAAIDAFVGRWFLAGLFSILGGVFFTIGLILGLVGWAPTRSRAVQAAQTSGQSVAAQSASVRGSPAARPCSMNAACAGVNLRRTSAS